MDSSGLLSLKWNNHSSTFTGVLSHLRINNLYTDATLACEGKVFSVHKLVLSTCSEYFQKIFEETDCRRPVIVLKDIKHTELDALLNYMYLGEVNVLQKDLSGLIKAAECLQVKGLAVADDVPSPPHRTNNSTHFKKSTKRLTSTSSDQEKSKRSRREPEQISDENEHTQSSTSRGKFNAANELHRESRQLCKANSKPSDDQRALKGTSQEIILDEEIKSEAFSPKLEDVDDYEANPSFDEAAQVSSAASSIQSSMQHHRPSADSVAHEDEGTANSEPKNSNSIQQDFSSDDILETLPSETDSTAPGPPPCLGTQPSSPATSWHCNWQKEKNSGDKTRGFVNDEGFKQPMNANDDFPEVIDSSVPAESSSGSLSWLEQSVSCRKETNYVASLNQLLSSTNLQYHGPNDNNSFKARAHDDRLTSSSSRNRNSASSSCSYLSDGISTSSTSFFEKLPSSQQGCLEDFDVSYDVGSYVCTICSKSFVQRCLLKRHMKIHDVSEKCKCHFCPFETTFKFNLKSHMARKHQHFCDSSCQLSTIG
ncbi:longitudinals lacking protein, isoforms H/M/V isoform X2 [Hyalella azteca]|uniref:Longitudinals lacking protein, isoforms H/M/V isoform X2 n=1 Tax=Hyalella azteca TaxID=294128 RepID=A0A8B7PJQ6_HYAAZ|nr:longitudinals lacking protein, isoforms H/M/V isoform X2 [Hyalella azteca]